jgi:1,4-alpha-glucan branching enzyme
MASYATDRMNSALTAILERMAPDLERLAQARHGDPFAVLGAHERDGLQVVLVLLPRASAARIERRFDLTRWRDTDLLAWAGRPGEIASPYRVSWIDGRGQLHENYDPYSFPLCLKDEAIARFNGGYGVDAWRVLGAHVDQLSGIGGVRFAVWAPEATRVSLVGSFNGWDGRRHPMRLRHGTGVWELFLPGLGPGELYKFELRTNAWRVLVKADPYGREFELRPATAARVTGPSGYPWRDGAWCERRANTDWRRQPMSIYEVHLGSWRRAGDGEFLNYRELAPQLAEHAAALGFTHVELLPVTEHPLDESWGYQATGFFAPTRRHGTPDDLRYFVDYLHTRGLGVLLDWVPGHFPRDAHALARFDGSPLYEYPDPRKGEHRDWGTLVFNYERHEVRSFLLSSACYWLEEFHVDGLRVDAVASMIYLDYSRPAGSWSPNRYGGRENLEAISLLRELNATVAAGYPGALTIAEESTEWPRVTGPPEHGGLGFSLKWNMGWMHDTLSYFALDPLARSQQHERMTFSITYAWSERFVLPFSHDEVVHLKRSLLGRMPGDDWQRHANLRLLYCWAWTFPGRKLLFMGGEFAQGGEWNASVALPWPAPGPSYAEGIGRLLGDLNGLYRRLPALHASDDEPAGFLWLDPDDRPHSIYAYLRRSGSSSAVVVLNCTPVPRPGYRVGLPHGGDWVEQFNSDSAHYGGSNLGNLSRVPAESVPAQGCPCSAVITLPPLAAVILLPEPLLPI